MPGVALAKQGERHAAHQVPRRSRFSALSFCAKEGSRADFLHGASSNLKAFEKFSEKRLARP